MCLCKYFFSENNLLYCSHKSSCYFYIPFLCHWQYSRDVIAPLEAAAGCRYRNIPHRRFFSLSPYFHTFKILCSVVTDTPPVNSKLHHFTNKKTLQGHHFLTDDKNNLNKWAINMLNFSYILCSHCLYQCSFCHQHLEINLRQH